MQRCKKYAMIFIFMILEYIGLRYINFLKYKLLSIEPTIDIFVNTNRLALIAYISYMMLIALFFIVLFLRDRHSKLNIEYASFIQESMNDHKKEK